MDRTDEDRAERVAVLVRLGIATGAWQGSGSAFAYGGYWWLFAMTVLGTLGSVVVLGWQLVSKS